MEFFCKSSQRLNAVNYFRNKAPLHFSSVFNTAFEQVFAPSVQQTVNNKMIVLNKLNLFQINNKGIKNVNCYF